ncbi:MAG: hypothetical protein AABW90_00270 [Nanoarchaeota archaeon]
MKKSQILFLLALILISLLFNSLIIAQNGNNETSNETQIENISTTTTAVSITKFFPKEVKVGDVQFNMQIQNNLNENLKNIAVFISGKGFSTYEIIPIEELTPLERDYVFINGNFKVSGNITLTIRINSEIFYENVSVIDTGIKIEDDKEFLKKETLRNLSIELENLKKSYVALELELSGKKEKGYAISNINLEDLKKYMRDAESGIIIEDINFAKANLKLAQDEYDYQKEKLDNAKIVPIITRIKENAILISTIIGAVLAFFALSEILNRQTKSAATGLGLVFKRLIKMAFNGKWKKKY